MNKSLKLMAICSLVGALALGTIGCTTTQKTTTAGAVVGAGIGAALGGSATSAVVGSAAGAGLGYIISKDQSS